MTRTDRACVLSMRVARETARMDDLAVLLPLAVPGYDERYHRLEASLRECKCKAASLATGMNGLAGLPRQGGEADALVNEVVALLVTRLLREQGLESGTFDVAEALLRELASRARVPAPTVGQTQDCERDDCTHNRVDVRFPGSRIWEVPVLAHEFGHHAIAYLPHRRPELGTVRPLRECVGDPVREAMAGADPFAESHADELVADAIATACCGPAYAVAALCLRVPAGAEASRSSQTHPAWRDRVATMRAVLDALSERTGRSRYSSLRAHLIDPLAVTVLGESPQASGAYRKAATSTVRTLVSHCPRLVYQDGDAAIEVKAHLDRKDERPPRHASIAAVLDGGWAWRLEHATREDDDATEKLLVGYCREIAKGWRHGSH